VELYFCSAVTLHGGESDNFTFTSLFIIVISGMIMHAPSCGFHYRQTPVLWLVITFLVAVALCRPTLCYIQLLPWGFTSTTVDCLLPLEHWHRGFELHSNYKCVPFLGVFSELWKATINFLVSVCLSVRPHGKARFTLDGFSWDLIFEYFSKICREKLTFVKIWLE
jgi:hypothetical protein